MRDELQYSERLDMEDSALEQLVPLGDVPKIRWLPRRRGGGRLATATVYRWRQPGVHGLCLRCVRVGGTWCTTQRWLMEFFEQLAQVDQAPAATPMVTTTSAGTRRAAAAARRLAAEGL